MGIHKGPYFAEAKSTLAFESLAWVFLKISHHKLQRFSERVSDNRERSTLLSGLIVITIVHKAPSGYISSQNEIGPPEETQSISPNRSFVQESQIPSRVSRMQEAKMQMRVSVR